MRITRPFQMLIVAVALVAAACGSGTTALDTGAAEVVGADSGVQTTGDVSEQYPFLDYVTNGDPEALHPGRAVFVLVDEAGDLVLDGPENYPAYGISISVWAGVDAPFVSTLGYSNYEVNAARSLGEASRCGRFGGNFEQLAPDRYLFQGNRFPQIQGTELAWEDDGCPPPPVQQAEIFSGEVEIEFQDDAITIISSDSQRWNFRQVFGDAWAEGLSLGEVADVTTTVPQTTTTTTAAPETTTSIAPSNEFPNSAPVAGATLSGEWVVTRLEQNGEDLPFEAGSITLRIEGRSFNGSDGCNSFGGGGILWSDAGEIETTSGSTTLVGCSEDVDNAADAFSPSSWNRWGFTTSGELILEGPMSRVLLEATGEPLPLGSFEGTHELAREVDPFSALGPEVERPLLTIAGSEATLTSTDCTLEFTFAPATANAETPLAFTGIDPSACPEDSASRLAAEALAASDYGLALATEEATGYWLWSGLDRSALFVTPGFDPEAE